MSMMERGMSFRISNSAVLQCHLVEVTSMPGVQYGTVPGYQHASAPADEECRARYQFHKHVLYQHPDRNSRLPAWLDSTDRIDVLVLTVYFWNRIPSMAIARAVKTRWPDCAVVVGGNDVSYLTEVIFAEYSAVDILVHGDGELTFRSVLRRLAEPDIRLGDIPGISYRTADGVRSTAPAADGAGRRVCVGARVDHPTCTSITYGPIATARIDTLLPADSPRLEGEKLVHTQTLAKKEADLPPILVHWPSMRVVDGMHRLRAAIMLGRDTISVRFVDGSEEDAFLLGIRANLFNGLPLTLADRKAAAARILVSHPDWSDRMVGSATGLTSKTVGAIRRRSGKDIPHPNRRTGRDGRVYPLDAADGRRRAYEIASAHPDASIREIASAAGISVGTAFDVRKRMRDGKDPICLEPAHSKRAAESPDFDFRYSSESPEIEPGGDNLDWRSVGQSLKRDPTLRYSESGRSLLKLLDVCAMDLEAWDMLANTVPPHWASVVAGMARSYASQWHKLAQMLEHQAQGRKRAPYR